MAQLTPAARIPLLDGLRGMIGRQIESQRAARSRLRTYLTTHAELSALSDRDLADIGVARSDIDTLSYEQAYGTRRRRA